MSKYRNGYVRDLGVREDTLYLASAKFGEGINGIFDPKRLLIIYMIVQLKLLLSLRTSAKY